MNKYCFAKSIVVKSSGNGIALAQSFTSMLTDLTLNMPVASFENSTIIGNSSALRGLVVVVDTATTVVVEVVAEVVPEVVAEVVGTGRALVGFLNLSFLKSGPGVAAAVDDGFVMATIFVVCPPAAASPLINDTTSSLYW